MKGLGSLIRLNRWTVDERRRDLAELEKLRATLAARLRDLAREHSEQQEFVRDSTVVAIAWPAWAAANRATREKIAGSIDEVDDRIEIAREAVSSAWRELRKVENAMAGIEERRRLRRARIEQQTLDDVALEMYRRRDPA